MLERQRSWSVVQAWTSCRVQASFHAPSVALEWAAIASSALAASTGCTRNAVGSSAWQRTLLQMYTVAGNCIPLGWQPQKEVKVGPDKLEVAASFCYLGDVLLAAGGCELSTTTRVKTALKKFKELLPVLFSLPPFQDTQLHVQLLSVEHNAPCQWDLAVDKAKPPASAAKWQICNVKPQDIVTTRSNELLAWLGIEDLDLILKERRLRWYGHVECSNGPVKTTFDKQVDGKCGPGRPKMTWKQLIERDCREWKLSAIDPHDRHTWKCEICHACSKPAT